MADSHDSTNATVSRRTLLGAAAAAPALAVGEEISPDAVLRGPRSFPMGTLLLADGRTFPIRVESIGAFYRLVRLLPCEDQAGLKETAPAVQAAVIDARRRWDAEAARSGLPALEQRIAAAHDRARALLDRLPTTGGA